MSPHVHHGNAGAFLDVLVLVLAAAAALLYGCAVVVSRRRGRAWPVARFGAWLGGIALAATAAAGPLAGAAHGDFVAHMGTHLLAGMTAPILLVLSAPVTLALRALPTVPARRLSALLRSAPLRALTSPWGALILSAGGLWALYLTPVYAAMSADPLAHVLGTGHVVVAGYLFTAAVIGRDPSPHPPNRMRVAAVLVAAMAAHAILAKYLYAHPPAGVDPAAGRTGAELMYYAGAWAEAIVVGIFCADWYRTSGRELIRRQAVSTSSAK